MGSGSLTFRLGRTAAGAAYGVLRSAAILALVLVIALPLMRIAADWYVRGSLDLTPVEALPAGPESRLLAVKNGTPQEVAAVRQAIGGLRYRIDPRTISVVVVDENPFAAGYAAEYLPYVDIIRVQRAIIGLGGPGLRWTLAHEVGHYVDQRYMTAEARQRFRKLRGIPESMSWEGSGQQWQRRPVEDFAEVFAAIAQTAVLTGPATTYGPVRDAAAFEALLRDVGVVLGAEPAPRSWQEVLLRELALVRDTVTDPSIERPLAILLAVYIFVGAIGPARRAWRLSRDAEGVPLDRERRRVLNTSRQLSHRTGRSYVTDQGRHHGGRG